MKLPGAYSVKVRGQNLCLLPQRGIFWQEEKTLIVADVHLGKAQTFQRAGIPISDLSFHHDLARLTDLIRKTNARRLLILGDFVHHRSGLTNAVMRDIQAWCDGLEAEIILVVGNHDKPNRIMLAKLSLTLSEPVWQRGPFIFAHDDQLSTESFRFFGHLHPVVNLPQMRLPVFAFFEDYGVLPAFSYFTGGAPVERDGAQIYVPLEDADKVMALPTFLR